MSKEITGQSQLYDREQFVAMLDKALRGNAGKIGTECEILIGVPANGYWAPGFKKQYVQGITAGFNQSAGNDNLLIIPGMVDQMQDLGQLLGWQVTYDTKQGSREAIINGVAPRNPKDKSNWVIEYGNFPEVAGNPHVNLHEMVQEMQRLIVAEMMIAQKNNTQLLDFSYHPTQDAAQVVPAERPRYMMMYKHQTDPCNRVAINGATTQFNLDLNQDNYVLQMEALTYLAVLLPAATWNGSIAYNPETGLVDADNGLLTQRPQNWQEGFPGNAPGPLLMALNAGFSHQAYVDMLEKIPMIIKTTDDGGYVDAYNDDAQDYIKQGSFTMSDARNLLKSVRSDIRITMPGVVEFRPLDSGSFKENMGIGCMLYAINEDRQALEDIIKVFHEAGLNDPEKLMDFRTQIISNGLHADNGKATELYKQVLNIANTALAQRNLGEEAYLQPLRERVESGVTPAEQKRELFNDNKGDVISVVQSNVLLPDLLIFDNIPDNDRFIDQQRAQYRNKLSGEENSYVSSQEKQFGFVF